MNFQSIKWRVLGAIRHHVPPQVFFWADQLRGECNLAEVDPDDYFYQCYNAWKDCGLDLQCCHVLELGSGRYARVALRMLAAGASQVTLVDHYAIALDHPDHQRMLRQDCKSLNLDFDQVRSQIHVISDDFCSLASPALEQQVDFIVSRYVLEHVRNPQHLFQQCWHWLKPTGWMFHTIDLGCHGFSSPNEFEMLTFSDQTWERWFNLKGGFHLNRWRLPEYLQAVECSPPFSGVKSKIFVSDLSSLQSIRSQLDQKFQSMSDEELSALRVYLYAQKRLGMNNDVELGS